jgi:hypothetical protein
LVFCVKKNLATLRETRSKFHQMRTESTIAFVKATFISHIVNVS